MTIIPLPGGQAAEPAPPLEDLLAQIETLDQEISRLEKERHRLIQRVLAIRASLRR